MRTLAPQYEPVHHPRARADASPLGLSCRRAPPPPTPQALLHRHGLNTAYTGGLSSYSLVIMVARFLLDRHALNYTSTAEAPAPATPESAIDSAAAAVESHPTDDATAAATAADDGSTARGAPSQPVDSPHPCHPASSPGALLLQVLSFYGRVFDPTRHAVLGGCGGNGCGKSHAQTASRP